MNTFKAIETQIKSKVAQALDENYSTDLNQDIKQTKNLFQNLINIDIQKIRKMIISEYSSLQNITEQQRTEIVNRLVDIERQKMEEKMAIQLAIDYLSGMTDKGFNELAVQTGYMRSDDLKTERVDASSALQENEIVKKLVDDMRL